MAVAMLPRAQKRVIKGAFHKREAIRLRIIRDVREYEERQFLKNADPDELYNRYEQRALPTQDVVSRDEFGNNLKDNQLEFYSESKLVFHPPGGSSAALLPNHLMHARNTMFRGRVGEKMSEQMVLTFLAPLAAELGMELSTVTMPFVHVVLGPVLRHRNVRFHGTSLPNIYSFVRDGLEPKVSLRKDEYREHMGPRGLTVKAWRSASGWSQYIDIGLLKHCGEHRLLPVGVQPSTSDCVRVFANAVAVFDDSDDNLPRDVKGPVRPTSVYVEIRDESELHSANRKITPHVGCFF